MLRSVAKRFGITRRAFCARSGTNLSCGRRHQKAVTVLCATVLGSRRHSILAAVRKHCRVRRIRPSYHLDGGPPSSPPSGIRIVGTVGFALWERRQGRQMVPKCRGPSDGPEVSSGPSDGRSDGPKVLVAVLVDVVEALGGVFAVPARGDTHNVHERPVERPLELLHHGGVPRGGGIGLQAVQEAEALHPPQERQVARVVRRVVVAICAAHKATK
eukprot:1176964-Prorocentrum_minimum.AAC.2